MAQKMMLNPDKNIVQEIREALRQKGGYCPCLVQQNEDTKCPCKNFREKQECHCGLFVPIEG